MPRFLSVRVCISSAVSRLLDSKLLYVAYRERLRDLMRRSSHVVYRLADADAVRPQLHRTRPNDIKCPKRC